MSSVIRPLAILCAFVFGWFVPQGAALNFLIPWLVGFMLFATFLGLDLRKLTPKRSHFAIVVLNLGIGIAGYFLVGLFAPGNDQIKQAALFAGLAPTATAAPAVAGFLKRQAEYVVTGLVLSTAAVALALPALLSWVLHREGSSAEFLAAFASVAKSVGLTIVLPILLARICRAIFPKSRDFGRRAKNVTFAAWVSMIAIIACRASKFIRESGSELGLGTLMEVAAISLAICMINFGLGYCVGEKNLRPEASQTLGQKNTGIMIAFASMYAEPLVALGPTFYVLWHNSWNAIQLALTRDEKTDSKR
ncbi:MAG: hypothetical protein IJM30_02340 [Thermoguttaceae bacterium]|nr:hypothetical protein [Thermoguttaceae bacterium]